MLLFSLSIIVLLHLIALACGLMLLTATKVEGGLGTSFAKFIGFLIVVLVLAGMFYTGSYAIKYWKLGYFEHLCPMMMHDKMMSSQPMMQDKAMPNQMMPQPSAPESLPSDQANQGQMMQNQPMPSQPVANQSDVNQMSGTSTPSTQN